MSENFMDILLYQHDFKNHVKDKGCFKKANNPCRIDLILSNKSLTFFQQLFLVFLIAISYFKQSQKDLFKKQTKKAYLPIL